ncbi:MAG: cAMP/cGMP-dependent 3',5'-cyclic-AMP/GMP phosphodiesterase [Armatimonadetes bacterium]|nr:cAMP/cGMP-dependent 3',5'-cyclic-AMP/GMP phosphodiesterase [Armatimonadota bacterium]
MNQSLIVENLARGGTLVRNESFLLQIGAYPETIKDTMGSGVPDLFLVPAELFDTTRGISAADLEFPIYYNYFLKNRKLRFICRRSQHSALMTVLTEAIFGPAELSCEGEFVDGPETPGYPHFEKELAFYQAEPGLPLGRRTLRDMAVPLVFNEERRVTVDGVAIDDLGGNRYLFSTEHASQEVHFERPQDQECCLPAPPAFEPPMFGVTIIGSGHGFDAAARTSGFILWVNGSGILVDPPVNSTRWLEQEGVDTRRIHDIILTHCHADHDSGTLQKVLQEGRVRIHTTPTVIRSFVRKYGALTGLSRSEMYSLFDYSPVLIDQPVNISGGEFRFRYRLHPIPTVGFEVFFQGKSFVYSSDTLYDEKIIHSLHDRGVISRSRMEDLLSFPWHHSLVLHEAGMAPVHTPMEVLEQLPPEVKSNLYLTHISEGSIPPRSELRLAPTGSANTLILEVPCPELSLAQRMLDVLGHVDLFRILRVDKAAEFLRIAHYSSHPAGQVILRRGTPGTTFHIVLSGEADVIRDGGVLSRIGRYDYFGEMALLLGSPRGADVVAKTDLELLTISRYDFLCFIRGTRLPGLFRQVAENRARGVQTLAPENRVFGPLSAYQKAQLLAIVRPLEISAGENLFEPGQSVTEYFLIDSGEVEIEPVSGRNVVAREGALLGRVGREFQPSTHTARAIARSDTRLLAMDADDLMDFFRENPGVYVRLMEAMSEPFVNHVT